VVLIRQIGDAGRQKKCFAVPISGFWCNRLWLKGWQGLMRSQIPVLQWSAAFLTARYRLVFS
jgi:hypothetical protein